MRRLTPLLLLLALAGCTDDKPSAPAFSQPAASSFAPGPCSTMADTVLQVGRDARALGTGATPPEDVRDRLKQAQAELKALQPGLTPDLAEPVDKLVVAIGLVRIRADGNTYEADLGTALSSAYDGVVDACT